MLEQVLSGKDSFLPDSDRYKYQVEYVYGYLDEEITLHNYQVPLLVSLSHFLPDKFLATPKSTVSPPVVVNLIDISNPATLISIANQITRFFSSQIRYLGPLRADPGTTQRTFAPTSELDDVGFKGEYAAVVYHNNQAAQINWYNPNTTQIEKGTLQIALDAWARYLGVAHQVRTETAGPGGIAWKVVIKQGLKPRTLPEVGGV